MKKILIINGPNLNLLGKRDKKMYGSKTLENIEKKCFDKCKELNYSLQTFQSNHEGDIIDILHKSDDDVDFIILNPGAFTHYSIAIRDAIEGIETPVIEVHMTNIYSREEFRRKSVISPVSYGQISGFGYNVYLIALEAIRNILEG
ncbi:type II 3-dehydroquinate dehydratase [Clostridium sp. D2Q-11]|uniref:3-dehydroquinate dehydratase n=1 Tax=Anaeromonas frigoriresistens TaxID=2683708 RepID=A0A942UXN4_9FIRM|nr:type II 3-dehydroquinate dehydratase [Anaeromonas frigoriresistens]MBS4540000.1 type II 3-dehydroquinate dehydratase [Anaeromonas frigoriresistens]